MSKFLDEQGLKVLWDLIHKEVETVANQQAELAVANLNLQNLTIGDQIYNGSKPVVIPLYKGENN